MLSAGAGLAKGLAWTASSSNAAERLGAMRCDAAAEPHSCSHCLFLSN